MDVDTITNGQNAVFQNQSNLKDVPSEILDIIKLQNSPQFLESLSLAALKPSLTLPLFTHFHSVFADTCAKWISSSGTQINEIIEAFARILPLAPHLFPVLENYLQSSSSSRHTPIVTIPCLQNGKETQITSLSSLQLQRILLAAFRLLNFNKQAFAPAISGATIQSLLHHEDIPTRYLAVRVFCQLRSASDLKLEQLIEEYIGKEHAVLGDSDGKLVDYGFLALLEESRLEHAHGSLKSPDYMLNLDDFNLEGLSNLVVRHSGVLLPRPNGSPAIPSALVPTSTTLLNKERLAKSLLSPLPILLHGLSGSGKTSLVNDFARELGVDSNMVTLHLNEQTDAKMLIGMYTSGATPGSFTWRAGVLTTAVREGRWVFIEDLDRAPNEVISVILPLIERGELLIPSRSETIRAGSGFRLFASIRTSLNVNGHETPPAIHMLGARLWQRVPVHLPPQDEFREIIDAKYPILHEFLPQIIAVYNRLYTLSHKPSFASKSRTSLGRPISPRDLLKWCRRLLNVLEAAGSKTGREAVSDATIYQMFQEGADCFASSLQTEDARRLVVSFIAEELNVVAQTVEHFLTSHVPRYEEHEKELVIGRARIPKRNPGRISKPGKKPRPFANTNHAKRLLEQVGVAVSMSEPVLLVGETGIGKTTVVQQLADVLGFNLTAVNLSQQSEVGDLLGGFKPVNVKSLAIPLKEEFDDLFDETGISKKSVENQKWISQLERHVKEARWDRASKLWHQGPKVFKAILTELAKKERTNGNSSEQPAKRRKTVSKLQSLMALKPRWDKFAQNLYQFDVQLSGGSKGFAFTFVEGNIVKAARNGDWVLLDEINLASPDTLESIADLLHSGSGVNPSLLLSETGEIERIHAHPNFRIFGAMNPATDVGKRDLPMGLRSRFTEIYVDSPDRDKNDLLGVIRAYIKGTSSNEIRAADDVASLYLNTKRYADDKRIVDGANQVPHFSLRTLTRVLSYVTEIAPSYGLRRALYEGFAMGFLTLLDRESEKLLEPLINHHLLEPHGNSRSLLTQAPKHPEDGRQYKRFTNQRKDRQYWMLQGKEVPQEQPHYIITPFVERNMLNLVRATSTRRFPVLVQGPTSSGKTSMIEYLAKFSGNKFVRINNHEHTDLQEYLGTYVSGSDGQLRFQEGLLVQALRQGHWIVLDELNLAPTDVLEALNRLLDDNRELLIPETQEIVRPHENFMLFATQNPPGLYGGRKTLSRAFRNRFLELHFDDIPEDELHIILEKRSQKVAPSDCKRIVTVYKELSRLRQSQRLFEQKDSFATLRDLFRWALRDAENREQLAANGYMLLGERVRNEEEKEAVKDIIEKVFKVKIDTASLYAVSSSPEIAAYDVTANTQGVVWTRAMRRLYILVAQALRNNEPILLVGETGCGKTTVCQMLADAFSKELHIVNAHQNTETGDLIGAQRPVRNRASILDQLKEDIITLLIGLNQLPSSTDSLDDLLAVCKSLEDSDLEKAPQDLLQRIHLNQIKSKALFEWTDGSLVQAMRGGQFFLLDEISLADDSVLERLNSVLETQRTILLAEKGIEDSFIAASDGFQFFATMNPGGDYGKRELSPALRNRFTEIWVPSLSEHEDILHIVKAKLKPVFQRFANGMVEFAEWFGQTYRSTSATAISVRDVLAWVNFMNKFSSHDLYFAVLHGAAMVFIDTLGANPAALLAINPESILQERENCLRKLGALLGHDMLSIYSRPVALVNESDFMIGGFSISKAARCSADAGFAFDAPTTKMNAMRVLRALQVQKPILIEGSPGVGKTTLISALAQACGKPLTRINLSEQTDLMDLFGSDVPVEGAEAGYFAWRDAPFLQAMQKGEWVLLDEMNLASQSVLEGLNACLDHRGEVYVSELDQTFKRHPNFSVFAAQNPHHQGGGRKGLPSSFVNRFTVVYADVFRNEDLELICKHNFPATPSGLITNIIQFVSKLEHEVVRRRKFGSQGGPWEFNLRDILRWIQLLSSTAPLLGAGTASDFLNLIFRLRFRTANDRLEVDRVFAEAFGSNVPTRHFFHSVSSDAYQVGLAYLPRDALMQLQSFPPVNPINRLPEIESVMICIQQSLPCILVGPSGSGKTTLLQHVAATSGKSLITFPLNSDIDTMDLVGGFEQVDPQRNAHAFLDHLRVVMNKRVLQSLPAEVPIEALEILESLRDERELVPAYFTNLARLFVALGTRTSLQDFASLGEQCQKFAETPMVLESARFEWVDGVLIKALEQGKWLVLDNANLCSASVLDRLNSLLEPNGFLSINEHCMPNGEPKIVKPHPNFRIFLTMDARFGDLSRAMRNRAIEIFLEPLNTDEAATHVKIAMPESSMQRYKNLAIINAESATSQDTQDSAVQVAIENLAWSDMPMLSRFASATELDLPTSNLTSLCEPFHDIYIGQTGQTYRAAMGRLLRSFQEGASVSKTFRDAQTLHPLQNSPLVPLLQQSSHAQIFWIAMILEMKLGLSIAHKSLRRQEAEMDKLKVSQMNRFQLSMKGGQVSINFNSSTVHVSHFLMNTLNAMESYLHENIEAQENWVLIKKALSNMLQFWWDIFNLAIGAHFEETAFQAHLAVGNDLFSTTATKNIPFVADFLSALKSSFGDGFKLTTGLSMEVMWKQLRPVVVSKQSILENIMELEVFAAKFDALRWDVSVSVANLGSIMHSLVEAYHLVLTSDVDSLALIETLTSEVQKLEGNVGNEEDRITPFMIAQFAAMRQYKILEAMRSGQEVNLATDIIVLANQPTLSEMQVRSSTDSSRFLKTVDYLWGQGNELSPVMDSFSADLLHRLHLAAEVDMKSLKLLETELPTLGEAIASSSQIICRNQVSSLSSVLTDLLVSFVSIHGQDGSEYFQSVEHHSASITATNITFDDLRAKLPSTTSLLRDIQFIRKYHFDSATLALKASREQSATSVGFLALAWVDFAVGAISLYVPDKAFDPDKRQRVERERHATNLDTLRSKLSALQHFERVFTGQTSNLRCQLVEAELLELGEPPKILQEIYRPKASKLNQLQGEFNNLLQTVVYSDPHGKLVELFKLRDQSRVQEIRLLSKNVSQIIRRLTDGFRAYSDLTTPIVSMLRCLQIGLSLATTLPMTPDSTESASTVIALSKIAPFLSGGPIIVDNETISNHPLEYLGLMAITSITEGVTTLSPHVRDSILSTFHIAFEQSMKRREKDKEDAESKSGLYRFRGSEEDAEEDSQNEFNELFPAYDDDTSHVVGGQTHTVNDTAVAFADVHALIFLGASKSSEEILSFIRQISRKIGANNEGDNKSQIERHLTSKLLPGALLILEDRIASLSPSTVVASSYNFYSDPNLPETRNLVHLIHRIISRFRELQGIDEIGHMQPLEDVLVYCRELLQFRHTEPLAKIITKLEKVHEHMHEWQFGGWVSHVHTAKALYDNVTDTIISWRRLELSTWAKLFDMETKKCNDLARFWWFDAYQIIVAAPLSISESEVELRAYARELLKILTAYFSRTSTGHVMIMGKFIASLQMLVQLQKHIELLMLDHPLLSIIHTALINFIALYTRYKAPISENLKKGRTALEKTMKDVLLMASWKDTNIVALRDSAKRSHHKLFKIVRKFRALLGQPMDSLLKSGIPDETMIESGIDSLSKQQILPVDPAALALCASSVPNWSQKNKRFTNVSKTVSIMLDLSQLPEAALDGSAYLDSFLTNIVTTTAELQKATPSILTEENKPTVKHLKLRKTNLFNDTLKELRQMGIKAVRDTEALSSQEDTSTILTATNTLGSIPGFDARGLEYYFHKLVDLAPRARDAMHEHSEDLSKDQIARSMARLEGLVKTVLSQRNFLASSVQGLDELGQMVSMAQALWSPDYEIHKSVTMSSHRKVLRWLPSILEVSLELFRVHGKLGKLDNDDAINEITLFAENLFSLSRLWDDLAALPENVISSRKLQIESQVEETITQLDAYLDEMIEKRPDLTFILGQIKPWIHIESSAVNENSEQYTISDLDNTLSAICDNVLITMQEHKEAIRKIPTSTDDSKWFSDNDKALSSSIKALYSNTDTNQNECLTTQLSQAFKILRGLDLSDAHISKTAGAIVAVALPILQQHLNILQKSVVRYAELHRATCKTSSTLAKLFIQIATQGFCTPSEKSDDQQGKTDKLEGGTGLGEGEGAEDISKDIQDDENLDELAQQADKGDEEKDDIENEKDAVDMEDGEMEGEMGDAEENESDDDGDNDESGDDMDEEAGSVDDLDPTAVDEKMWDGEAEEADKEQDGDQSKGKANKDEQVAAQENAGPAPEEGDEGEEEEEMVGEEQGEEVKQQDDVEKHDPHADEGEALDLPEDMELDKDADEKDEGSDDGMNDLSDMEDAVGEEEMQKDSKGELDDEDVDPKEDQNMEDDLDVIDLDEEEDGEGEETEEVAEKVEEEKGEQDETAEEEQDGLLRDRDDEANADADNAVPSDVQGAGEDQEDNAAEENDPGSKAQREDGGKGGDSSEKQDAAAEDSENGRQASGDAPQDSRDETQNSSEAQPFKQLGDALESWHRQQTQIREAPEQKEQPQDSEQDMDYSKDATEFQHLQDEDAQADDQALGTATEEQAKGLDESMAVDTEAQQMPEQFQPDETEGEGGEKDDDVMDLDDVSEAREQEPSNAYEGRAGAMVHQSVDHDDDPDATQGHVKDDIEEDVEEVDTRLESTHLGPVVLVDPSEARKQWTQLETTTRPLSLALTEQLRLILAPTLATKMRGDFRTGKRLNIKRIIPYIASQYKRDKIWMRRSVPSKRAYQIMLAVDDSKSMGESGSGQLALETLVLVSKALSMLETGELCILGFGENTKVTHAFEEPFSSEAGVKIFEQFAFQQERTNITALVRDSIALFRTARERNNSQADLWQVELIISDGVCNSSEHEPIRQLLRQALEERIMVVFVVVDDVKGKKKGESVLDLKEARFVDGQVQVVRYLDGFPFRYYVVVSELGELPGVLSGLLRQWFGEVAGGQ